MRMRFDLRHSSCCTSACLCCHNGHWHINMSCQCSSSSDRLISIALYLLFLHPYTHHCRYLLRLTNFRALAPLLLSPTPIIISTSCDRPAFCFITSTGLRIKKNNDSSWLLRAVMHPSFLLATSDQLPLQGFA
jgi:hypothetical protein